MSLDNGDREKVMTGILARPDMIEFVKHLKHVASVKAMLISAFRDNGTHTSAFPDFLTYMNQAYQCPSHRFSGSFSQKLSDFLRSQQLEVLVPIATTLYGITGDVQFGRLCKLSTEAFDSFMIDDTLEVSAFHQRVLHLAFQKARLQTALADTM
ncbi:hypothetical protein WG66_004848 [Moniliophthora roreri]|uniref:Uncharacterized protein n=1 Tax=Moniliophthora roreri TaxID=221103 RepID=A0A0W0EUP9_MONRR|nr:hypothetical protein WG66_004848 [Moniliophthora roreri]